MYHPTNSLHLDITYGQTWHPLTQLRAVYTRLVIGFCGQPHFCNWPYSAAARFWSTSVVSAVSLLNSILVLQSYVDGNLPRIGCLWTWPRADHEPQKCIWCVRLQNLAAWGSGSDTRVWLTQKLTSWQPQDASQCPAQDTAATTATAKWNDITNR